VSYYSPCCDTRKILDRNYFGRSRRHAGFRYEEPGGERRTTGCLWRDTLDKPLGYVEAAPVYAGPVYDRKTLKEMIEERERKRATHRDLLEQANVPLVYQDGLGYCWAYSVTRCYLWARAKAGLPYVELSTCSFAAKVMNYRNAGNMPSEAVDGINRYGISPTSIWPDHALSRRLASPEQEEDALTRTAPEWSDVPCDTFEQLASAVLTEGPAADARARLWGHATTSVDPVILPDGRLGFDCDNQWGSGWGDNGRFVIVEDVTLPEEFMTIRTTTLIKS
jgi:hypothetical protein